MSRGFRKGHSQRWILSCCLWPLTNTKIKILFETNKYFDYLFIMMYKEGDMFINPKTGGVATIIKVEVDNFLVLPSIYYYTLRGNRLGYEVRMDEDKLNEHIEVGRLEWFKDELQPKKYKLKFNFVDSW